MALKNFFAIVIGIPPFLILSEVSWETSRASWCRNCDATNDMMDTAGKSIDMKTSNAARVLQVNTGSISFGSVPMRLPGNPSYFASSLQKPTWCGNLPRLKEPSKVNDLGGGKRLWRAGV